MSGALFAAVVATTLGSSAPTYILSVAGNATSVDEGADLTFYVNTTNVEDGTTLYVYVGSTGTYDISSRFSNGTGTAVAIYSNVGSFTENVSADNTTAGGTQSYNIFLSTTSSPPTPVGNTVTITVNDTSQSSVWFAPTNHAAGFRRDVYSNDVWDGTEAWFAGKTVSQTSTNSQLVGGEIGFGTSATEVFRGYFVATSTGNVTFTATTFTGTTVTKAWFGNVARGVPSDNTATFTITGAGNHTHTISLTAGDYYPLYVVTGAGNGGGVVIQVNGSGLAGSALWNDGTHAAYNTDTGGI